MSFKANGAIREGYLAKPDRLGPAVVVIQEWWRLVPHIEGVARRFAAEGFGAIDRVAAMLPEAQRRVGTIHTYPDADHAFFNDQRPEVYDAAAAADGWKKTLAFFRRELNG